MGKSEKQIMEVQGCKITFTFFLSFLCSFCIHIEYVVYILISLRISEVDDLALVGLPTMVEGLQRANAVKEETGDDRPNPLR